MEGLIRIQKSIQVSILKDYANFKQSSKAKIIKSYIDTRLESLEADWKKFQGNNFILLAMDELSEDNEYLTKNIYDDVKEIFHEYKSELKETLAKMARIADKTNSATPVELAGAIELPQIEIPKFSGMYTEWPSFHALFNTLIHKNTSLSDVQKLYYLKGHVIGDAEQLLRHVPITENNYEKCWELINDRYSNKRYLANSILNRLFGQKNVISDDSNGIKGLLDTTNECLSALSNLDFDITTWDIIIIYIISGKLDQETRKQWEQKISNSYENLPTLKEFNKFLEARFRTLEILEPRQKGFDIDKRQLKMHVGTITTIVCSYCGESHVLSQCRRFALQEFQIRLNFIQNKRLCYNCFGAYHRASRCNRYNGCHQCHRRHHTLLHPENQLTTSQRSEIRTHKYNDEYSKSNESSGSSSQVILPTALVKVENKTMCASLRALLDQGSQASFISEGAVKKLGLRKIPVQRVMSGLGGEGQTLSVEHMVELKIQSTAMNVSSIQACVLNSLSPTLPRNFRDKIRWPELMNLDLADPQFDSRNDIDLILGADVYGLVLKNGVTRDSSGSLTAQNTHFGWVVSGRVPVKGHCIQEMWRSKCMRLYEESWAE